MAGYDAARAAAYDATRSASPSLVAALLDVLGPERGSLLDIGGGTGNYAVALRGGGFAVTVLEPSAGMLHLAAGKIGNDAAVQGDALNLPFKDGSFDNAVSVNVSHHVPDWRHHVAEARRVVRRCFAIQVNTRENLEAHWIFEYFPKAKEPTLQFHPPGHAVIGALEAAGFRYVTQHGVIFSDRSDATFEALKHWPETYLDEQYRRNTTFFTRLPPEVERRGVERLREEQESGALRNVVAGYEPLVRRVGDSTVFAAYC